MEHVNGTQTIAVYSVTSPKHAIKAGERNFDFIYSY